MKKFIICAGILFIAGCATQEPIKNIIRDQQFSGYKAELDQLEKDYLKKDITYAEYLKEKKRVEDEYQQKIDDRQNLIENQNPSGSGIGMVP